MNECLTSQSLIPVLEIEKFIDLPLTSNNLTEYTKFKTIE